MSIITKPNSEKCKYSQISPSEMWGFFFHHSAQVTEYIWSWSTNLNTSPSDKTDVKSPSAESLIKMFNITFHFSLNQQHTHTHTHTHTHSSSHRKDFIDQQNEINHIRFVSSGSSDSLRHLIWRRDPESLSILKLIPVQTTWRRRRLWQKAPRDRAHRSNTVPSMSLRTDKTQHNLSYTHSHQLID